MKELEAHNNFNSVVPGLEEIQTVDLQVCTIVNPPLPQKGKVKELV